MGISGRAERALWYAHWFLSLPKYAIMAENNTTNITFRELLEQGKRYLNLHLDYVKLTAIEKLSIILGMSVLFSVILTLSVGAGIYLSFAVVYLLEPLVGIVAAYAIVGAVCLILIAVAAIFKRRLILDPITRFVSRVLLNDK